MNLNSTLTTRNRRGSGCWHPECIRMRNVSEGGNRENRKGCESRRTLHLRVLQMQKDSPRGGYAPPLPEMLRTDTLGIRRRRHSEGCLMQGCLMGGGDALEGCFESRPRLGYRGAPVVWI